METVFRWSVWGRKRYLADTLPYSVASFRRAFGRTGRYVVFTDEPSEVKALLGESADVLPYGRSNEILFDIDAKATWKKWCPAPRLDSMNTEFYVDSDVFLVGDPEELRRFSAGETRRSFQVWQEAAGAEHKVGHFAGRILRGIPPVNTGLLGQRPGTDLTKELLAELHWWQHNIAVGDRDFHDDQGAVIAVLARYYLVDQVDLLPQDRYRVVSPASNRDLDNLDGVVAIHATYGNHPAFYRFQAAIEKFISDTPLKVEL